MTLKLTLFSQEVEDFVVEILIDADARFAELHDLILNKCNYAEHPKQLFIVCDEDWRPIQRVRLQDDTAAYSDEDVYLMRETSLREFLDEEGQHMAYRFDPEDKRHFLIEVSECLFGQSCDEAKVNRSHGIAPDQFQIEEMPISKPVEKTTTAEEEEDLYGDEGFEEGEIDAEGFEISEDA